LRIQGERAGSEGQRRIQGFKGNRELTAKCNLQATVETAKKLTQGLRGMAFIGFVELVKQGRVENGIPFIDNNSKNTTNPRNTINHIRV
jgi:hypothetical protein